MPIRFDQINFKYSLLIGFLLFSFTLIVFPDKFQFINNLFYLFVLLPALIKWVQTSDNIIGSYFFQGLLVLLIIAFISIVFNQPTAKELIIIVKHAFYLLGFYSLLFILSEYQKKIIIYLFIYLVIVILLSFYKTKIDPNYTNDLYRIRSVSAIGSSPLLADLLGCYGFYLFIRYFKDKDYLKMIIVFSITLITILILEGRAIIIALFVSGLLWLLTYPIKNRLRFFLILIMTSSILFIFFYLIFGFGIFHEMIGRGNGRIEIWQHLFQKVKTCGYFLGCGYHTDSSMNILVDGRWNYYPYYHNIFLSQFFYTGIFGFVIFLGLLFKLLYKSYQVKSAWGYIVITALICLLFEGNKVISNPSVIWYLFWIPVIYCYLSIYEKSTQNY